MSSKAKFFVALLVSVLAISFSMTAKAEMSDKPDSPFKNAVMKLFGWTSKTTEKSVNAIGAGVKKSADVVVEEVKDVGELATGKGSKAKDVLVNPVTGITEAAGETAYGVLNAPIEAGEEVGEKKEATK